MAAVGSSPKRGLRIEDRIADALPDLAASCMRLGDASEDGFLRTAAFGGTTVRDADVTGKFRLEGTTPADSVYFQFDFARGRQIDGAWLSPDVVAVASRGADFVMVSAGRHRGANVALSQAAVETALERMAPGGGELVDRRRIRALRGGAGLAPAVRARIDGLFAAKMRPPGAALLANELLDLLAGFLLEAGREERDEVVCYQRTPVARRAEEFIRANAARPIALHEICHAARASERTVERAFHDVYSMGVKRYLRVVRLNEARRSLESESADEATVGAVAARCGFWHAGRFATEYRRLFGESPSLALRRRPA